MGTIKVRANSCLSCGTLWANRVEYSKSTANISGERTRWCPTCGGKAGVSSPVQEIEVDEDNKDVILDIDARASEAYEALQLHHPELESVVNDEILSDIETVIDCITFIQQSVERAVGGPDKLIRLRYEREQEDEQ